MGKFKKGQSGNPGGRPKQTEEEQVVKKLTKDTFNDLCHKMMTCTQDELEDLLAKDGIPYESALFIRHMLKLGDDPDWHSYEKYLARRIGPVKQELEVTAPRPTVIKRKDGVDVVLTSQKDEDE